MLRLYYADALTDKEKFIFDQIDPHRQTILIVPDQFSLQAEEDALRYCGSALLDLMVTDFSALGHKVVKEIDGHEPRIIDKYGRHMLLSVLLGRMNEELTVFRSRAGANALADQMNTMISELKRYEIGPEKLSEVIRSLKGEDPASARTESPGPQDKTPAPDEGRTPASGTGRAGFGAASYLVMKLEDLLKVYEAYEEAIGGLYRDAEDYITYYAERIPRSALIRGADVWLYGFDTFTPKNLQVIRSLLLTAENVSVVMTHEEDGPGMTGETPNGYSPVRSLTQGGGAGLFLLTEHVMQRLEDTAEDCGAEHDRRRIVGYRRHTIWNAGNGYGEHAPDEAACQEDATGKAACQVDAPDEPARQTENPGEAARLWQRIGLARTSSFYEEAERAAALIQSLARDEGYRYGEIAVICNDMDGRGRQLLRAFERWDIPAFADQKRKVLHQPVVSFLLSFLDVLTTGFGGSGIIGMLKSGMTGWSMEDEILLENYITEFRIRGSRWQKEFHWDGGRYTEEELKRINEMRGFLVSFCEDAKDLIGRRNTAEEKIRGLVTFLQDRFRITARIEEAVERQQALGLTEGAMETAQIWNAVCGIFDQIVGIIGPEKISNRLLREMIGAGLESLEIGLVPSSRDCVIVGTLQRSRPGRIRALIVTGANAGLLPLEMTDEGLLSRREKERLEAMDLEFAGRERIAHLEEQLAIYRMFSLPTDRLYVSCSQSGDDGSMLRPSEIFRCLQQWQPDVAGDLGENDPMERVGSRRATVPYLAEALREAAAGGAGDKRTSGPEDSRGDGPEDARADGPEDMLANELEDPWTEVLRWYREHDPLQVGRLMRGVRFNNRVEALGDEMADALYRGDREALQVSASRLEHFSGCPFAHFVRYGLKAQEQKLFEVGGREIGDVYHQCMMTFSRTLEGASAAAAGEEEMPAGAAGDEEMPAGAASAGSSGETAAPTWQTITEGECRQLVAEILQGNAENYHEGLFASDAYSQFRMERITEICGDIAWTMVQQVRRGRIRRMYFEQPFGNDVAAQKDGECIRVDAPVRRDGGNPGDSAAVQPANSESRRDLPSLSLPAISVPVGDRKVLIRGFIDRLDVIDPGDGGPDAIRIVDYKTGRDTIRTEYFQSGYKLQLMVYMDAALRTESAPVPAGVFYFKISDYIIDGDKSAGIPDPEDPGDLQRRMEKNYRLEGVVVNDAALIGAMDERVDGSDKAESTVIPVKYDPKKACYQQTGGGTLLETEEFRELLQETNRQVERICAEICRGEIAPAPKRESKTDREGDRITACRYCGFQSICGFDPAIKDCRFIDV